MKIGYTQCIPLHFHLHPTKNHNVGIYFCSFVCVFSFNINQICKFMLASTQQRTSIPFDEQGFNILNI